MSLPDRSLSELVAALASGAISSVEVARHYLDRIEAEADLSAFSQLRPELVLAEAAEADASRQAGGLIGPLHGVPVAIKDNVAVRAYANSAGTPALAGHVSEADAPVVARLRAAGAIILGKTTMHELAWGTTSINPFSGTPKNPVDRNRSAGGSSGGAAAAIAAHLAPLAIGTDTGGSIRIPASLCGCWGFRPSAGRWPNEAIVPISSTRDTPGPLARAAADLALADCLVTGQVAGNRDAGLAGRRIGIPRRHFWDHALPEVEEICMAALDRLAAVGAILVEVDVGDLIIHHERSSALVSFFEGRRDLVAYLARYAPDVDFEAVIRQIASPDVRELLRPLMDPEGPFTEAAYHAAMTIDRPRLRAAYARIFADHAVEALAFPTVPMPAFRLDEPEITLPGLGRIEVFPATIHNTGPGSNAGIPGISMPAGKTAGGLPVGLAFDAPQGRDADLLDLAILADKISD